MTNKELADIMFPNVKHDIEYYENLYPERNLKEGAVVSRFAPSPTGFVHMGSLLAAFIERKVPKQTGGVFFLRIEDTDGKRTVENGIGGIIADLKAFHIDIDEGVISETESKGEYGPYIQSERKEIYETYAKYLVEQGLAYPCFCTPEEIEEIRSVQEKKKDRIGYYGRWAKCKYLSNEERIERIKNGEKFIVRLNSPGNFDNKVVLNDLVRGRIEMPENDMDIVLIKSDGLPLYHFAHVIDDHLMRTTHVLRGEEWIPSTPCHLQLFKIFGWKAPKYAHLGLVMKIGEDGARRKLSKRKDPEAAVSFYHEKGIPVEAVKYYLMTIANSNFEAWWDQNKDKTYDDFTFDFKKMSLSGSLFDLEKLLNISKNYISTMKAEELYDELVTYTEEFDSEFHQILKNDKDYALKVLNIEREKKKPRKDYAMYSDIRKYSWYMFDELFEKEEKTYDFQNINDKDEIKNIVNEYFTNYYDENDDHETWFNKMKELAKKLGYADNMKDYKENPDNYKGNITDIATVIRVAITTQAQTPDLYEILQVLGKDSILKRIEKEYY